MIVCSTINDAAEKLLVRSPSINTAKVKRKPYTKKITDLFTFMPKNALEAFSYFCDVPRNIRLPLWRDQDIAGPHRINSISIKRKLNIKKITTYHWTIELKGIHFI
jgi:hypothetical protein